MFSISGSSGIAAFSKKIGFIFAFSFSVCCTPLLADSSPNPHISPSCDAFLRHAGLQDVLNQLPRWIDAEIAASNGFLASKPELAAQIKQRLNKEFVELGKQTLCANTTEAVGDANVELAGSHLAIPAIEQLTGLRSAALQDEEHFVEYQKKMRGLSPLELRQEWIRKLDQNSGVSAFKAALWSELRKTVLWSVGAAGGKHFSEAELDHELISFQRDAVERAQRETSEQWLFAYRTVPDSSFEQLFAVLDLAATQKTAAAALAAVRAMGKGARQ